MDSYKNKRNNVYQRRVHQTEVIVKYQSIRDLKLDPKNPRIHSSKQIAQKAKSIDAFGFNVPVLVDANLKVVAGHGRIAAAQLLGLTEVPTIPLDHLSEAQNRAFMIADNRLTETSAWNELLLAEQLKELAELNLDFSLEVTGFEMGEIDLRIEGLKPASGEDPADELPAVGPQITQTGDLWELGWHRILCATPHSRRQRMRFYLTNPEPRWFSRIRLTTYASKETSAAWVRSAIAISLWLAAKWIRSNSPDF
jgi:ParB-like nuclease domain